MKIMNIISSYMYIPYPQHIGVAIEKGKPIQPYPFTQF